MGNAGEQKSIARKYASSSGKSFSRTNSQVLSQVPLFSKPAIYFSKLLQEQAKSKGRMLDKRLGIVTDSGTVFRIADSSQENIMRAKGKTGFTYQKKLDQIKSRQHVNARSRQSYAEGKLASRRYLAEVFKYPDNNQLSHNWRQNSRNMQRLTILGRLRGNRAFSSY